MNEWKCGDRAVYTAPASDLPPVAVRVRRVVDTLTGPAVVVERRTPGGVRWTDWVPPQCLSGVA